MYWSVISKLYFLNRCYWPSKVNRFFSRIVWKFLEFHLLRFFVLFSNSVQSFVRVSLNWTNYIIFYEKNDPLKKMFCPTVIIWSSVRGIYVIWTWNHLNAVSHRWIGMANECTHVNRMTFLHVSHLNSIMIIALCWIFPFYIFTVSS